MDTVEILHGRANPGVDPGLHIWGWEVPVYLFLGGMVAGILVLTAAMAIRRGEPLRSAALRWAPLGGLALLSVGLVALFLDLEHKLYVWRFYLAFRPTSPMSWGGWIVGVVFPVGLAHWLGGITADERAWLAARLGPAGSTLTRLGAWLDGARAPLLWTTVGAGVGLGLYTGLLLGTLPARFLWSTSVLAPLFLVSGVSTGAALLLLLPLHEEEQRLLVRWDVGAIVTELALLGVFLVGFATGGAPQRAAAALLLGGEWTAQFWSLVIITGLLAPLTLGAIELRTHRPLARVAPVLVLVGGFSLRAILVAAGQDTGFRLLP